MSTYYCPACIHTNCSYYKCFFLGIGQQRGKQVYRWNHWPRKLSYILVGSVYWSIFSPFPMCMCVHTVSYCTVYVCTYCFLLYVCLCIIHDTIYCTTQRCIYLNPLKVAGKTSLRSTSLPWSMRLLARRRPLSFSSNNLSSRWDRHCRTGGGRGEGKGCEGNKWEVMKGKWDKKNIIVDV